MSHITEIDIEVQDLDSLDKACKTLGLELVRDQHTYRWYGRSMGDYVIPEGFTAADLGKCSHAIRIPGNEKAYEIGVVARRDGRPGYTLMWDFWQGGYGMQKIVGEDAVNLVDQYSVQIATKYYQSEGYSVTTRVKDGEIILEATR